MIVTSKRCYLNILTQLMDRDTLLNANYYIADKKQANGLVGMSNSLEYVDEQIVDVNSLYSQAVGSYNIKYSNGELDPEQFKTDMLYGNQENPGTTFEQFMNHLNSSSNMIAVYNFLFKGELRGNGLQILIYYDDENLLEYGHCVCQYLAYNFGVDIIFIDPQYRPNCRGYSQYQGDKNHAQQVIHDLRDISFLANFDRAMTQSEYNANVSNLTIWLGTLEFQELLYLYGLLFPDDPLPPGNYTSSLLQEIIISKTTAGMKTVANSDLGNLYTFDWTSVLDRYEREAENDSNFNDI